MMRMLIRRSSVLLLLSATLATPLAAAPASGRTARAESLRAGQGAAAFVAGFLSALEERLNAVFAAAEPTAPSEPAPPPAESVDNGPGIDPNG